MVAQSRPELPGMFGFADVAIAERTIGQNGGDAFLRDARRRLEDFEADRNAIRHNREHVPSR